MTAPRRALRPTLLAVATTASMLVLAMPAAAEKVEVDDYPRDVWDPHYTEDGEPTTWEKVGDVVNANLLATTVRHQPRRVVVLAQYADAKSRAEVEWGYLTHRLRLGPSDDDGRYAGVVEARLHWGQGRRGVDLHDVREHAEIDCDGLDLQIDFAEETVAVSVPRSCLGRPDTVGVRTLAQAESSAAVGYWDVAGGAGHGRGPWTADLVRG